MALLLDTNVTSELRRARQPGTDPVFARWAASVDLADAFLSVLTIHEMMRGALLVSRRDPATGAVYRAWIDDLRDAFDGRILEISLDAATVSAGYHVPDPVPLADALIAGTAAVHSLTVATRNTRDYARFGVPLLNPWHDGGMAPCQHCV